ncbi:AGAP001107-PA-like protein [Anopheles sinensis]|uniref:AGAP001107-PA-like protein n=1 Tax=Anopheles sinensis TaxID=74873 RepID=A0A084W096_ANOSI|nr:AGAP001107-PA-like protein [Anopheles sinensis]
MEAANSSAKLAKDDVLTASISSEDSDSWTLLGKNADQLDKEPSGVEILKTESEEVVPVHSDRKQRHDSQRSNE